MKHTSRHIGEKLMFLFSQCVCNKGEDYCNTLSLPLHRLHK